MGWERRLLCPDSKVWEAMQGPVGAKVLGYQYILNLHLNLTTIKIALLGLSFPRHASI